jgi:hypothetical protein
VKAKSAGALLLLAVSSIPALAARPDKPRIDAVETHRNGAQVEVAFRLAGTIPDETLERLRAGIPVRHHHRVELVARRSVPLWTAKLLSRIRIDTEAVYDSLTQRFKLTRKVRTGPNPKKKWLVVEESEHSTGSVDELVAWMTGFDALPPLPIPEWSSGSRLRVRIESTLGRRFVLYLFPTRQTLTAERKLEDG